MLLKALSRAQGSIYLSSFGYSDPELDQVLQAKADQGLSITVVYDRTLPPPPLVGPHVSLIKDKRSGLMHRKVVIIDEKTLFLGSTNATESSYKLHYNHMIQMEDEKLAAAVVEAKPYETAQFTFYPLPAQKKEVIRALGDLIDHAEKKIYLAIFTLTHQVIINKIIESRLRGVDVQIVIDQQMARGASLKAINELKKYDIPLFVQRGSSLFHHKCALIDDRFVLGSANWTKSGFEKNREYLIIFWKLEKTDLTQVEQFTQSITRASKRLHYSNPDATRKL